MFGTSISPSDRNARERANQQALDFLYGRTDDVFSWNLYQDRSDRVLIPGRGGFIPGFGTPFKTRCARSFDCGQGYFCNQGICTPVGTGNTGTDEQGGCSTGPNENGGIGGSDTCGSSSGTGNLGKCASPGCGSGGPQDCDGPRCCRFRGGSIQCWFGRCSEQADGSCSGYCSGYRSSFGSNGAGCSDSNSCTECSNCVNGNCVEKTDNVPCHCNPKADDNCGRPGQPLTCCNYKDTCQGRILLPFGQPYCHPTYRVGFSRCYDPTFSCDDPEYTPSCKTCENFTSTRLPGDPPFSLPSGCKQTGFIRNEETGEEKYLYQCCDDSDCGDNAFTPSMFTWYRPIFTLYRWFGRDQGWNATVRDDTNWIRVDSNRKVHVLWNPYNSHIFAEGPQTLIMNLNSTIFFAGSCVDAENFPTGCGSAPGVDIYLATADGGYASGGTYTGGAAGIAADRENQAPAGYVEGYFEYTNDPSVGAQYTWVGNPTE